MLTLIGETTKKDWIRFTIDKITEVKPSAGLLYVNIYGGVAIAEVVIETIQPDPSYIGKQLRAIPSEARAQASRDNGKKGGRKRRCHECKEEIKPGDSWERHSYGKGRYLYCSNCAERIRQEQRETDRMEDRRYP